MRGCGWNGSTVPHPHPPPIHTFRFRAEPGTPGGISRSPSPTVYKPPVERVTGWDAVYPLYDLGDFQLPNATSIRELIGTILGERYADRIDWVSTYQFLQVTADSFVDDHRRVLLVGEAAHLFAPFGARGMNSGVADADEAASAIVAAANARSRAVARAEVERFAEQRERAAEFNRNAAGQALEHLQGDGLANLKRVAAAKVADYWEPAGEWLDEAPYGPNGSPPTVTEGKY